MRASVAAGLAGVVALGAGGLAAEAIGVTFLMGGGPSTIYGPRAHAAFCEFTDVVDAAGSRRGSLARWADPGRGRPLIAHSSTLRGVPSEPAATGDLDASWLNDRSGYQRNFVHGLRNPVGLKLQYRLEDGRVVTDFTAGENHMGFPGFAHGGLIIAVLDDAMGRCAALRRRWVVTGRFETRFRSGAAVGTPLRVEAWITRITRRAVLAEGLVLSPDGAVIAEAGGTYLPITPDMRARMLDSWPGFAEYLDD